MYSSKYVVVVFGRIASRRVQAQAQATYVVGYAWSHKKRVFHIRSLDNWARDERFVRVQIMAGGDTEEIMERVKKFASSIMSLHISTRTFLCRRGEPPPDAAADEPEGGLEAYARHFM